MKVLHELRQFSKNIRHILQNNVNVQVNIGRNYRKCSFQFFKNIQKTIERNTQQHTRKVKSKEDHMSKKLFTLLSAVIGALGTIAVAVVTYINPPLAVAINTSIGIAVTAAVDIMAQFAKEDKGV